MRIFKHRLLALAALCLASGWASAAMKHHPTMEHSMVETGAYINGGVGKDGRQALRAERRHYNLRLAFAQARTGEYLAGVTVTIHQLGSSEPTVRYEDSGPMFYIRLAPGHYRVTAEYRGKKQVHTLVVGRQGTDRVLYGH